MNVSPAALCALASLSASLGGWAGWRAHTRPPAPAVAIAQDLKLHELQLGSFAFTRQEAPVRVVEHWNTAATPDCPASRVERITERGPVVEERRAETATQAMIAERTVASITPQPPATRAGWAVGGGVQFLPVNALQLHLGRRIVGPVWVEAWAAQPLQLAAPAIGVGLRVEF